MVIINGTHRMILLFGSIVVKFPRFGFLVTWIYDPFNENFTPFSFWNGIAGLEYFWQGILENWDEFRTWKVVRAEFLAPTYLSLGFINIQKRIHGLEVSENQARTIWRQLYDALGEEEAFKADKHTLMSPSTYRQDRGAIVMIDYGTFRTIRMRVFLKQWKEVFARILKNTASG